MRLTKLIIYFSFTLLFLVALTFQTPILLSPSHPVEIDDIDYEEIEARYGITFPIPELDNCATFSECLNYCEDPVNYPACIEYAREKGFYEEDLPEEKLEILERAKEELGCDSFASCRAFCEQEANYDTCHDFAETNQLTGGYEGDPEAERILEKAKDFLGCDSYESCTDYCAQPENHVQCSKFADRVGIRGGEHNVGPGGCTSEDRCSQYCSDPGNYDLCSRYAGSTGGDFVGPGGCNSEESCRDYCEENYDECRYFGSEAVNPETFCKEHPEKCAQFIGRDVTPGEFERFCLENPDECIGKKIDYDPAYECNRTPQCTWADNTCQCYEEHLYPDEFDPATECANYGCNWTGITCECSESGGYDPYYGGDSSFDPAAECTNYGCNWTGITCECAEMPPGDTGTGGGDPAAECANYGCNWTGSTCECPSSSGGSEPAPEPSPEVYGLATVRDFLQGLVQFLFAR